MIRRPPISTRTDTLFPYTTLFRSLCLADLRAGVGELEPDGGQQVVDLGGDLGEDVLQGLLPRTEGLLPAGDGGVEDVAQRGARTLDGRCLRSEESRVGKACLSTCRSRWLQ